MTAPYTRDADQHVRQQVGVLVTAEAHDPSWAAPLELVVESATVTFDEGWAPHVRGELVCQVPAEQDALDALDPRLGVRVLIRAGYRYPDGTEDVHDLADLILGERTVERSADGTGNRLRLVAHSDEILVQGWRPLGSSVTYPVGKPVGEVVADLITWAVPDADVVVNLDERYRLLEQLQVGTGDNPWSILSDQIDHAYGWVYHDGLGRWHVTNRPRIAGRSSHLLKVGPNGTLTASTATLQRDAGGYANAVLLRYADDVLGWAQVTSGPLAPVNGAPMVVYELDRTPRRATADSARSAAEAVLRRTFSRGRTFDTSSVAALWVRPGDTVTVQLPTGPQERHLLASVAFELPQGSMRAVTRVPDNVTIETGE